MKKSLSIALSAITAVGLLGHSARAGNAAVTYATDDLLLGFDEPGATNDYVVDLGQISSLNGGKGLTQSFTILNNSGNYGNVAADLSSTYNASTNPNGLFGPNWYSSTSGVVYSLQAATNGAAVGSDGPDTLYTTVPAGDSTNSGFTRAAAGTQATGAGNIATVGTGYNGTTTANSNEGVVENASSTNSYAYYQPPGTGASGASFNYFNPSNQADPTTALDFERIATATKNSGFQGSPGTDLGTFSLDSAGDLTFTSINAVPEPSTYASLFLAAGSIFLISRRNRLSRKS